MKTRTKFVICSVINLIWFTLAVFVLTWFDKTVPDSLITAWFAAWTVELALLAGIKVKGKSEEEYVDESEEG
jgi:hypothetical protein